MRLLLLIAFALLFTANVQADEKKDEGTIPAFPVYYAMVSHVLKHDEGCFDQLVANPQLKNISEFWWGYILQKCDVYLSSQVERLVKQNATTKSQAGKSEEIGRRLNDFKQQCAMSVIFDNWDRINSTIVKNPQQECVAKKK